MSYAAAKQFLWPSFGRDPSYFDDPESIIVSAEGSWVTDVHGNRYIDSMACATAATLGFNHPHVVQAMEKQLSGVVQNPSGWPANLPQIALAEKIASLSPGSLQYTIYGCNGTDANEAAIKIARQYHKLSGNATKYKIIGRWLNYHGTSLATLAAGGAPVRRQQFEPLPNGFVHVSPPYCYRCKYLAEHPECGARYADELREAIEMEGPSTVAAVIGEQTVCSGIVLPPPDDYMGHVRRICDEYDVLLIVDEVVTAFGRTGTWFECEQYGIVPDMITMAKGLTGGHAPLAATHVKREIAEAFFGKAKHYFQHGYTFGGMPVSCAAALATIEITGGTGLLGQVATRSAKLRDELDRICSGIESVGDVRGTGMLFGIELVADAQTKEPPDHAAQIEAARRIHTAAKQRGVLLRVFTSSGRLVIVIAPPLTVTDAEIETILVALQASLREVENLKGKR